MSTIVPAVLPGSRKELKEKLAVITRIDGVRRIQIDVVDGKFATPPSWPYNAPGELQDMAERGEMLPHLDRVSYEVDLMALDAEDTAGAWLMLGATRLTFHAESIPSLPQFFDRVRARYGDALHGLVSFGIAVNLGTDPALIESCLDRLEYVQFMGIGTIGRQGESFDPRALTRVRQFRERHPDVPIQVDGGVSLQTAALLLKTGATDLVIGSAIVKAADPAPAFAAFNAL